MTKLTTEKFLELAKSFLMAGILLIKTILKLLFQLSKALGLHKDQLFSLLKITLQIMLGQDTQLPFLSNSRVTLSYLALGLKPGSSILTSPITFVSTANAAYFCGGNVRFADIDPTTINMGFSSMKKAIQQYPEIDIVVPVLFSGATEGVPEISKFAKANNKFVVEDAAHALGSSYFCGSKVGSCKYSDCTVFSFHPVKSIAAGEGGIITTNDEQIYKSC